jgi:hypothetical protein
VVLITLVLMTGCGGRTDGVFYITVFISSSFCMENLLQSEFLGTLLNQCVWFNDNFLQVFLLLLMGSTHDFH